MKTLNYIEMTVKDSVATIILNRPKEANAIDLNLAKELDYVATFCANRTDVGAVVLTGKGHFFCAGGDLSAMSKAGNEVDLALQELTKYCHRAFLTFMTMKAPLIVAVNGVAAGIGFSLSLIGDITIASENASFLMAYTQAGLSPDGGVTYLLPKAIGYKRAKELMLTNRKLSSEEAVSWGMVNKSVEINSLLEEASHLAKKLSKGPKNAIGDIKSLVLQGFENNIDSQLTQEAIAISKNAKDRDGQEGILAFLEKCRPVFGG